MNTLLTMRRFLPLFVGVLLVIVGIQVASSQASSNIAILSSTDNSQIEASECHPGSGWMWTIGPSKPEIASQVEQDLSQMGIEALVVANSYGETDSCGTFKLSGIDFNITINGTKTEQINYMHQQQVADDIYPMLVRLGKPNLGNVKITFHKATQLL